MAEAILEAAGEGALRAVSAGSKPSGRVHPLAIQVVSELGHDLSGARSKSMDEFLDQRVDVVITVCGRADQACPVFPGQMERMHWPFDDPDEFEGTDEEKIEGFRRVRDEIGEKFRAYAAEVKAGNLAG